MIRWIGRKFWPTMFIALACFTVYVVMRAIYAEETSAETKHIRAQDDPHRAAHKAGLEHDDIRIKEF